MQFSIMEFLRAVQIALIMSVGFCFWGMFDIVNWVLMFDRTPFPAPFFLFYLDPFAFGDMLIMVGCASAFGIAVIGNYHEKEEIKLKMKGSKK